MIIVTVYYPRVEYDTVIYSWNSSTKVSFFKRNTFYVRYKDIDLKNLPIEYFWYGFFSIMIPIYTYIDEDVLFKFPTPIPSNIAELWINYHAAKNVYIQPLAEAKTYKRQDYNGMNTKVGVLFGGGKDSTYALSVLNEIYGSNNLIILSYVLPYLDNTMEKHDRRRDEFLLNPIRDKMKIRVQKVYTDFYSNLTELKYKYSTNMAIYFGTLIPVLLHHEISLVTFSYEFLSYLTGPYNSNIIDFYFKRSRHEYTKYVAELTSALIKAPLDIYNFNNYISEIGSFKVITEGYPERLVDLLMCENITDNRKWCLNCSKCGSYVLLSMCYGNKYFKIDLNSFFEKSGYIVKLIEKIISYKGNRNECNNLPWVKELCNDFHYESHCHLIASINIEKYRSLLSVEAFSNLSKIKDSYGNKKFPIHESFIEPAFRQISPPIPEAVRGIVTKYCQPTNDIPDYFNIGNSKHKIDYNLTCSIPNIFNKDRNNLLDK